MSRGTASRPRARSSRTPSRRHTRSPTPRSPGDDAKLLDELGDLLFQVYFLALLLPEQGAGRPRRRSHADVHAKLVRRHPHVFGEVEARTAGRVRENWERIKRDAGRARGRLPPRSRDPPGAASRAQGAAARRCGRVRVSGRRGRARGSRDELRELRDELRRRRARARDRRPTSGAWSRARRRPLRRGQRRAPAERRPGARAPRAAKRFVERVERARSGWRTPTASDWTRARARRSRTATSTSRRRTR